MKLNFFKLFEYDNYSLIGAKRNRELPRVSVIGPE